MAIRLRDMQDLRRYMNNIINAVRVKEMKAEEASKLFYMLNVMTKVLHLCWEQNKMTEIEERLARMEQYFHSQED